MTIDTVTITSKTLSAEIATLGAELQRLTDADGEQLLWDGDPDVWKGPAPILFPVIGTMVGGQYRLDGISYPMPKHGFARHSAFEVIARSDSAVTMRLAASAETRAIYPFEFTLEVLFALGGTTLSVTAVIANAGNDPMPASFGFHPAFRWPLPFGAARADHRLRFAHSEPAPVRRIDRDGFLTPTEHPTPVEGNELRLHDDLFIDDALIFDRLISRQVVYGAPDRPRIQLSFEDFPMLGVWTKPGAHFICIEPWQGCSDPQGFDGDLRDKPGIVQIAPGAKREFTMRIALL